MTRDVRGPSRDGDASGQSKSGAESEPASQETDLARDGRASAVRIASMMGCAADDALFELVGALDPAAPADYRALAAILVRDWGSSPPARFGLAGGQGTGKSTLAALLVSALERSGHRAAALALDDYYLSREERAALARRVHPLLGTRGPPSTHDVGRLHRDLIALASPGRVEVPVFDKGLDEPVGTRPLAGPFGVVVLEGWCVGALAEGEARLVVPCNELEREHDPDGRWRRAIDARLASDYAALFGELDALLYLVAPDLDSIRRWRLEQEQSLPRERRKDAAAIAEFVACFERITRSMRARLVGRADLSICLAADHSIDAIVRRGGEDARSRRERPKTAG